VIAVNNAPERARWQVLWVKDGKVHKKDFEHDLMAAVELREKLVQGDRKNVTLRCCNMGFPPPEKYLPKQVKMKRKFDPPKIVTRGGKRYKQRFEIVTVTKDPMKDLNLRGVWWCPYCQKFRRFIKQNGMYVGKTRVADVAQACPICRITHRDHNVRKWNPLAIQVYYEMEVAPQRAAPKDRRAEYRRKKRSNRSRKDG